MILSLIFRAGSVFLTVEGWGNILFWWRRTHDHKKTFQLGRFVRGAMGLLYYETTLLGIMLTDFYRVGSFALAIEGFGNIAYWWNKTHDYKKSFQLGRLVRGALGLLYFVTTGLGWY